jgi:hypothetical protein
MPDGSTLSPSGFDEAGCLYRRMAGWYEKTGAPAHWKLVEPGVDAL